MTDADVHNLYTLAMVAELVGRPAAVVRRWRQRGWLVATQEVRRLPYFDFAEMATARRLAELTAAGVGPAAIDRSLRELARLAPDIERPLAELPLVVRGKQLLLRQGDGLVTPGGQFCFDFDAESEADEEASPASVSLESVRPNTVGRSAEELCELAAELEEEEMLDAAAEMYRAALAAGGPKAETCFLLAELLYRLGDTSAARERYYMAVELDEDYVEARANLGCVLVEQGQRELAMAAFEGALAYHAEYPDAHYHLARLLDETGQAAEAETHWRTFLELSPHSPWAEEARMRLDAPV